MYNMCIYKCIYNIIMVEMAGVLKPQMMPKSELSVATCIYVYIVYYTCCTVILHVYMHNVRVVVTDESH